MKKETIKSWKGKTVRIKPEYLRINRVEYASEYDDDGNVTNSVFKDITICTAPNGLNSILDDVTAEFKVVADVYGVDLYYVREDTELQDLREPQHLIILDEGYSFVWGAKWFEVLTREQVWKVDENFN